MLVGEIKTSDEANLDRVGKNLEGRVVFHELKDSEDAHRAQDRDSLQEVPRPLVLAVVLLHALGHS